MSATTGRVTPNRRVIDDLARYGLVAPPETLMSAKIQQHCWVAPSRLCDRVMQVGAREADIRQHVVVKTSQ